MEKAKPWYLSKTLITSGVAFLVALAATMGVLDQETGLKIESLLVPLILTFLRLGNDTAIAG
jgi:hypothetical protein